MNNLTAVCDIKAGKTSFVKENEFKQAIKCLADGRYLVTFEKQYKHRSGQQNKTFWGIAYKIIQQGLIEQGYSEAKNKEWVHEFCKENCLPGEYVQRLKQVEIKPLINEKTGEVIEMPFRLTTTQLTTIEAMEYYTNMQNLAAEFLGCEIPDPNATIY
jgi:hypothetical protein